MSFDILEEYAGEEYQQNEIENAGTSQENGENSWENNVKTAEGKITIASLTCTLK